MPVKAETSAHAVIFSVALSGFVTKWDGRNGNRNDEVDHTQAALVSSLGDAEVGIPVLPPREWL
jgi:hypothetical protein